jgi:hypothetical protein
MEVSAFPEHIQSLYVMWKDRTTKINFDLHRTVNDLHYFVNELYEYPIIGDMYYQHHYLLPIHSLFSQGIRDGYILQLSTTSYENYRNTSDFRRKQMNGIGENGSERTSFVSTASALASLASTNRKNGKKHAKNKKRNRSLSEDEADDPTPDSVSNAVEAELISFSSPPQGLNKHKRKKSEKGLAVYNEEGLADRNNQFEDGVVDDDEPLDEDLQSVHSSRCSLSPTDYLRGEKKSMLSTVKDDVSLFFSLF